mmetsp:Transcript_105253/g.234968  ORF Transcript_105253/g.234968 Transcript_105253/m.234968 type:complete len:216 (+) Transcript_105253:33-680(+)
MVGSFFRMRPFLSACGIAKSRCSGKVAQRLRIVFFFFKIQITPACVRPRGNPCMHSSSSSRSSVHIALMSGSEKERWRTDCPRCFKLSSNSSKVFCTVDAWVASAGRNGASAQARRIVDDPLRALATSPSTASERRKSCSVQAHASSWVSLHTNGSRKASSAVQRRAGERSRRRGRNASSCFEAFWQPLGRVKVGRHAPERIANFMAFEFISVGR